MKRTSAQTRLRRRRRIRARISGTANRPRLSVFRSLNHIYAQVIDDEAGHTLAAASTTEKEIVQRLDGKDKSASAFIVGEEVARRALTKGIETVVFDRGGYRYHGRVKRLAEGAREAGLRF